MTQWMLLSLAITLPTLAFAQTVTPPTPWEGTPEAKLKVPAAPPQRSSLPPAGVTWQPRAAAPAAAAVPRNAPVTPVPPPAPVVVQPSPPTRSIIVHREGALPPTAPGTPVYVGNGDYRPGPRDYEWVDRDGRRHAGPPPGPYGPASYPPEPPYGWGAVVTETTYTPMIVYETKVIEEVPDEAPPPRRRRR